MKRKKMTMKEMVSLSTPRLPKYDVEEIGDRVWQKLQAEMARRDLSLRSLYGDGWSAPALNQAEYQILTAISQLQEESPSELRIWTKADELAGSHIPAGVFPAALRGLTKRSLINPQMQVTEDGQRAMARARAEGKQLAAETNEERCTDTSS